MPADQPSDPTPGGQGQSPTLPALKATRPPDTSGSGGGPMVLRKRRGINVHHNIGDGRYVAMRVEV
jgi:hypothetical protein